MVNQLALKGGQPLRRKPFPTWPIFGARERQLLLEVLESGVWSYNGPKEQAFARRYADFCGAKTGLCVANGTVSLEIALRALGIGPGDEVIVPALTWLATAWAVVQVGATPVFADVRGEDWCLDPEAVRQKLTTRTRALIPVHLYNQVAEMDELIAIAKGHSLKIIEDCAHAHGARWRDRSVGTLGDIGSFSFQQSKGMTSGEGGILLTNEDGLADQIYGLKNCGRKRSDHSPFGFGGNFRITEFQAAVLLAQLDRLEEQLALKTENVRHLGRHLGHVAGIKLLPQKASVTRSGIYGVSLRYDPDSFGGIPQEIFVAALCAEGIPVQRPYDVVYRSPLWTSGAEHCRFETPCRVEDRLGLHSNCPHAERMAEKEGFVILHHLFLGTAEDMADIAQAIEKVQRYAEELRWDSIEKKARQAARSIFKKIGVHP